MGLQAPNIKICIVFGTYSPHTWVLGPLGKGMGLGRVGGGGGKALLRDKVYLGLPNTYWFFVRNRGMQ